MKNEIKSPYAVKYDLTNCDKEPVHIIRYVQPHALVIVCSADLSGIVFVSNNCTFFLNITPQKCLNLSPAAILPAEVIQQIKTAIESEEDFEDVNPIECPQFYEGKNYAAIAHVNEDGLIVIEIEPSHLTMQSVGFQLKVGRSIEKIQKEIRFPELLDVAAKEVKKLTGFDRVMVYQFDREGHGTVVAEALNEGLKPFLGLRYPATDIPEQARSLFLKNKVRFISDLKAEPALIFPTTHAQNKQPFDQTYSQARGTSPIHMEYLINMGVSGSMTVAILKNDKLWGLFACHHTQPIWLDYSIRVIVKLLSQIISSHLLINSASLYEENILNAQIIKGKIMEQMVNSSASALTNLLHGEYNIMHLFESCGAAICINNEVTSIGDAPSSEDVQQIVIGAQMDKNSLIWETDYLRKDIPEVVPTIGSIAGVLIMAISHTPEQQFLLWFRKEEKEDVIWAGNPEKSIVQQEENGRLSPRLSFEKWKQTVENKSARWRKEDANIALSLRSDIKEFFLKMYYALRTTNQDLVDAYKELDSFSYTVAHDLRAPLRSIKGFAQILEEDYEDKLDEEGIKVLNIILSSAERMDNYIDDILNISKLGRQDYQFEEVDLSSLIKSIFEGISTSEKASFPDRNIELKMSANIPYIKADQTMMWQLFENILGNAIKYSRKEKNTLIEIDYKENEGYHRISVRDNGMGFDMKYKDKIFEIFSRLTTDKYFEGTGVGMAIAQKIITKHNGRLDCFGIEGEGAVFHVEIPTSIDSDENGNT